MYIIEPLKLGSQGTLKQLKCCLWNKFILWIPKIRYWLDLCIQNKRMATSKAYTRNLAPLCMKHLRHISCNIKCNDTWIREGRRKLHLVRCDHILRTAFKRFLQSHLKQISQYVCRIQNASASDNVARYEPHLPQSHTPT